MTAEGWRFVQGFGYGSLDVLGDAVVLEQPGVTLAFYLDGCEWNLATIVGDGSGQATYSGARLEQVVRWAPAKRAAALQMSYEAIDREAPALRTALRKALAASAAGDHVTANAVLDDLRPWGLDTLTEAIGRVTAGDATSGARCETCHGTGKYTDGAQRVDILRPCSTCGGDAAIGATQDSAVGPASPESGGA
jgi:hypothetical protein